MTKSITSVLVGYALADDYIDSLDTPISDYLPELKWSGYFGVSIRRVMQMRSGVDHKTIDPAVLGWLIERAPGGSVAAYTASCLWEPLGAESDAYHIMDGLPGIGR
jgi:CubicO group peptidase (beta-lactamase class C family)